MQKRKKIINKKFQIAADTEESVPFQICPLTPATSTVKVTEVQSRVLKSVPSLHWRGIL